MKSMRTVAFAILGFVVLGGALKAQTNQESPKFSLAIKAYQSEIVLGSEIGIAITTTNLSNEPLVFDFGHWGGVPIGYEFDVRDESGAPVAKYGKRYVHLPNGETLQLPTQHPGGSRIGGIQPGKGIEQGAMLSEIYPFDHPGKYTIQVSRKESWSPSPVYSNTITVTVVTPEPVADTAK